MSRSLAELYRERKEKEKEKTKEKTGSERSLKDLYVSRNMERIGADISSRVKTWAENNDGYISEYQKRYSARSGGGYRDDTGDWLRNVENQRIKSNTEAANIREMLDAYGDYLDGDFVKGVREMLSSGQSRQTQIVKQAESENQFYSQFATKDDYDKWDSGWLSESATVDYDSIQKRKAHYESNQGRIAEIDAEIKELEKTPGVSSRDVYKTTWDNPFASTVRTAESDELKKLRKEREALVAENNLYERGQGYLDGYYTSREIVSGAGGREYADITAADLWKTDGNTFFDLYGNEVDASGNPVAGTMRKVRDPLGLYLSASEAEVEGVVRSMEGGGFMAGPSRFIVEGHDNGWDLLTDSEKDVYYTLLDSEGTESAVDFLAGLQPVLNLRKTQEMEKKVSNASVPEKILYNAVSIPVNTFGGVLAAGSAATDMLSGKEIDPYSNGFGALNFAAAVRDATAKDIEKATGNAALPWVGTTFGDVYQSLMSGADSLVGAATFGSGYMALMGTTAAASKMRELYERGASAEQMVLGGVLSGAAEAVAEKLPLDHLKGMIKSAGKKAALQVVKDILLQAGFEGVEEVATELMNIVSDELVMGSQSNFHAYIDRYIAEGVSRGEAARRVILEKILPDVANAGLGGVISGGGSGGIVGAGSIVEGVRRDKYRNLGVKKIGSEILEFGGVESVQMQAEEMLKDKNTPNAWEIRNQLKKVQKNPSDKNVGNLYAAMQESVTKRNRTEQTQQLKKTGLSEEQAEKINNAVRVLEQDYADAGKSDQVRLSAKRRFVETLEKLGIDDSMQSAVAAVVQDFLQNPQNPSQTRLRDLMNSRFGKGNSVDPKDLEILDKELHREIPTEGRISSDGLTRLETTGEAVQIDKKTPIAKIENGTVYLNTDHGVLETSDVQFANKDELYLYEAVSSLDAGTAEVIVTGYDGSMPGEDYVHGMMEGVLLYGKHGFQTVGKDISADSYFAGLSEVDQQTALKLGQGLRELETNRKIEQVRNAVERAKRKETAKKYSDDIDKIKDGSFDKDQNSHLKLLDKTPQVYIDKANAKDLEITMKWDVAYLAMNKEGTIPGNYHGLGSDVMKALPHAIEDPLYVVKQDNGRFIAITEIIVKGNRQVIASIEFDGYTRTREEGKSGEGNYNLIVTAMDAKSRYLKNTVFRGEVVYNKNNEDPAHFIARLNSLKKALPSDDLAGSSANIVPQNSEIVKGKVFYDERINLDDLTQKQRDEIEFAGTVIAAIGNTVHFYNSQYAPKDSREARTNGWYDPKDGSIHLDIAKIENGEESVLFTLSHELVHFIEDWSPAKYQTFANFLLKNYAEHGVKTDKLVREKMAKLNTTDYDYAMSELVADACERMLLDSNAAQKLAELNKTDKGLAQKIKDFFDNVLKRIRNAYANYKGRTEAQYLQKMGDVLSEFHEMFAEALADAARNYQDADGKLGDSEVREQAKIGSRGKLDPKTITKGDVQSLLTDVKNGKLSNGSYIPVRISTPQTLMYWAKKKRGDVIDNNPIAMNVEKASQAMARRNDETLGAPHSFSVDDMVKIIETMNDPRYIVYQNSNDRYVEVVECELDNGKKAFAVVEIGNDKDSVYMNGFDGGLYNILVTTYPPDSGKLDALLKNKNNEIIFDKAKDEPQRTSGSMVPSVLNDSPFYKDSIPQKRDSVNTSISENAKKDSIKEQQKLGSDRHVLIDAIEASINTQTRAGREQAEILNEYRSRIGEIEELQDKIRELSAEIKAIVFSPGKRDIQRYNQVIEERNRAEIHLNQLERKILKIETMSPLKELMDREKAALRKRLEKKGREMTRNAVKTRVEQIERQNERKKLYKLLKDTRKWIQQPTKSQTHCPDIFKQPLLDLIKGIQGERKGTVECNGWMVYDALGEFADGFEAGRKSAEEQSDAAMEYISQGYLDLPDDFVKSLRDMAKDLKKRIKEEGLKRHEVFKLSSAEIKQLTKTIRQFRHAALETQKLHTISRFANAEEMGKATMEFLKALGKIDETSKVGDFIDWENVTPFYIFKRFGEGGLAIFNSFLDAHGKMARHAQTILSFQEKTWTKKEVSEWEHQEILVKLKNETKLRITAVEAMSIYCLSRRNQAERHLYGDGIVIAGEEKVLSQKTDTKYKLQRADVEEIVKKLSARQIEVADAIQQFFSTECSAWGNEISMKRFLERRYTEEFYFPLETVYDEEAEKKLGSGSKRNNVYRLLNISATKDTDVNARNAVYVRNIFDVFASHASDMARMNAFGMPLLDFMKWFNYAQVEVVGKKTKKLGSVRESLNDAFGKVAESYVSAFIDDVNGAGDAAKESEFLMKMIRSYKTASVGGNLRVAALQLTAYPKAAAVLDWESLSAGSRPDNLAKIGYGIRQAEQYSGMAAWKFLGFYDTNVTRSIEAQIKDGKNLREKLIELSLKGAEWGDKITLGMLWNACEHEVQKKGNFEVGSEEFYRAVGQKLNEVIVQTQVVDSVVTRSQTMRKKTGMWQEATAFMSEPTLSHSIVEDCYWEFLLEKRRVRSSSVAWKKTRKYIFKRLVPLTATTVLATVVEMISDALRSDDDEEEKKPLEVAKSFAENLNPLNNIPIVSDASVLVGTAMASLFGLEVYEPSVSRLDSEYLTTIWRAFQGWVSIIKKGSESDTTIYNALNNTVKAFSQTSGVPMSNAMREIVTLWNNIFKYVDPALKIRKNKVSSAEERKALYEAYISGNAGKRERAEAQYGDQKELTSALRSVLKENDSRILEAAMADLSGNVAERIRIQREIKGEGKFSQDLIVEATNNMVTSFKSKVRTAAEAKRNGKTKDYDKAVKDLLDAGYSAEIISKYVGQKVEALDKQAEEEATQGEKSTSMFAPSDVAAAFDSGDNALAVEIITDLVRVKTENGTEATLEDREKKAKASVKSTVTEYWKPKYQEAYKNKDREEMKRIRYILKDTGLYGSVNDLVKTCERWTLEKE